MPGSPKQLSLLSAAMTQVVTRFSLVVVVSHIHCTIVLFWCSGVLTALDPATGAVVRTQLQNRRIINRLIFYAALAIECRCDLWIAG